MKTVDIHAKNKKFTAIAWALAALMLAVMIPLNLIFERLDIDFDMTSNSMYTLTKTTPGQAGGCGGCVFPDTDGRTEGRTGGACTLPDAACL